jgi:CheY-like chemotaxis protein
MRTLLLADDSITVQRVIALTFADHDMRVIAVGDAQQAMEKMVAERPDIVLAATSLPQGSGYELAQFMRSSPALQKVPVLLLSGAFEAVDQARLAASGASGVIEKPVEPTIVINRVKELLGLKPETKPATAGRLITSPGGSPDKKQLPVPTPPRAVTSTRGTPSKWEQLRDQSGLEPGTRSVEDPSTRPDGYLDTLDAAFDTLDQQLSGRMPSSAGSRNPSGPLGQAGGSLDPRSPGRSPQNGGKVPGNPVFEVDSDWFGADDNQARADAKAGRRQITEDLRDPDLRAPTAPAPPNPIFEVDDEWFAEDDKARAAKLIEQRELAAEMGIHDVDLPEVVPELKAAPAADLDFDFGIDDLRRADQSASAKPAAAPDALDVLLAPTERKKPAPQASASARPESGELRRDLAEAASGREGGPEARKAPEAPPAPVAPPAPQAPQAPSFLTPMPTMAPIAPAPPAIEAAAVADDFVQLLAFEQGEHHEPPVRQLPTAPITDEMLDQIAARVPVAPPAPITDEMLSEIASRVPVAPPAPITDEMLSEIAARVPVAPPAPITDEMLSEIAARVPVAPPAPPAPITDEMLSAIAARVPVAPPAPITDEMLSEIALRVIPPAPAPITDEMLSEIALRVIPPAPAPITDEMLSQIAARVTPPEPAPLTFDQLEDIARRVAERLHAGAVGDELREAVNAAVRSIVSETAERLVRDEIERIKSKPRP